MFGGSSSLPKENSDSVVSQASLSINTEAVNIAPESKNSQSSGVVGSRQNEEYIPKTEKKRRSSSVAKAASFFSSAKNSFAFSSLRDWSNSGSPSGRTFVVRYPTMDPNEPDAQTPSNSAGESLPTLRSSFRVGVTEDRNKKWRRTMEDTHAYLYNFLGTSPKAASDSPSTTSKTSRETTDTSTDPDEPMPAAETDNGYFAIFDGHAGTFAAEWCGKQLHLILEDIMKRNPHTPVPELLDQAFTSVDQQLEKLPLKNSGCTAVAAILRWEDRVTSPQPSKSESEAENEEAPSLKQPEQTPSSAKTLAESAPQKRKASVARQRVLYTANVGDARIVLCRNGKALRLSYDHKGSDENEGKRIANAGGLILNNRVNGILAVTRALGDAYMKELVTGHPYTTETVIQPDQDEFLILACDGLWDVCTDQEAVDLIRSIGDPREASRVLVYHALSRSSTDNLSCMVVRFDCDLIRHVVERQSDSIETEDSFGEADKILDGSEKRLANVNVSKEGPGLNEEVKNDNFPRQSVESLNRDVLAIGGEISKLDIENKQRNSKDEKRSLPTA